MRIRPLASLFLALGTLTVAHAAGWTPTGSMALPRVDHTLTLLADGRALAAGGANGTQVLRSAELYDPATGTWTRTLAPLQAREQHAAALLPDGRVLVTGGNSALNGVPLTSTEVFDPATGRWTSTGRLAVGRYFFTATRLADGRVLVVGGCNQQSCMTVTDTAELYNPATATWTRTGSLQSARDYHTATLLADGRVLVAGGYTNAGTSASSEIYDPATGRWSSGGQMTSARTLDADALLTTGQVLLSGGGGGIVIGTAETWTPTTGSWSAVGSLIDKREYHTATTLADGRVLVAGGTTFRRPYWIKLASAELYDPLTQSWSSTAALNTARTQHRAVRLADGRVLVAGGVGSATLNSAELFTP